MQASRPSVSLAQLCPRQGADDAVHTQTVGLLERQHGGLCLASEDAVHAAAVKSSRFRIGATVTPTGETHYEILAPDIDVTVNPAADDSLDTVALTLPYADTGKHAYTPDWNAKLTTFCWQKDAGGRGTAALRGNGADKLHRHRGAAVPPQA